VRLAYGALTPESVKEGLSRVLLACERFWKAEQTPLELNTYDTPAGARFVFFFLSFLISWTPVAKLIELAAFMDRMSAPRAKRISDGGVFARRCANWTEKRIGADSGAAGV
jgi:hypothetical protein